MWLWMDVAHEQDVSEFVAGDHDDPSSSMLFYITAPGRFSRDTLERALTVYDPSLAATDIDIGLTARIVSAIEKQVISPSKSFFFFP